MRWILLVLLAAVLLILLLLFRYALQIKLHVDTDKPEVNLKLIWLDPLINAVVTMENACPVLKICLFGKKVFHRTLNRSGKKGGGMDLVKLSEPTGVRVDVQYGFRDPFATGIACGVINMTSQLANIESVNQTPDFLSSSDYIYLNADAKVNLGSTLVRLLRARTGR